jgi:hypothetical protein
MIMPAILVMILGLGSAFSQGDENVHIINGVVKDARTKRPIAFASVFVPEVNIGTVANLNGIFTLKIPKTSNATQFGISHLGYHVASFSIARYTGQGQDFLLEAHSVMLDEVIVRPADPRFLVATALDKIETNYPTVPYQLTGFYREAIRQRRDYISISEAVVDIYQAPYPSRSQSDRTRIIQGRKSGNVKRADTLLLKLQGGPYVSMLLDIVKNNEIMISKQSIDFYEYEFLDIVKIEDESNYVIGFKPKVILPFPLYIGKLYLSVENLAITMAEFSLDLSDKRKAIQNFVVRKPATLRFNPQSTNYLVTYKKIGDKYHLNYVRTEIEFQADWRRRLFRTGYSIMSEMAITERQSENVVRFAPRESFRQTGILADMVPVYFDEDFWGDYNVIEPEESIEAAINRLNRRIQQTSELNINE